MPFPSFLPQGPPVANTLILRGQELSTCLRSHTHADTPGRQIWSRLAADDRRYPTRIFPAAPSARRAQAHVSALLLCFARQLRRRAPARHGGYLRHRRQGPLKFLVPARIALSPLHRRTEDVGLRDVRVARGPAAGRHKPQQARHAGTGGILNGGVRGGGDGEGHG